MPRSTALDECRFPVEIFELIFHELISGERLVYLPTLKACSLACKPLLYLCRPHIFSHIKYGPYGNASKTRRHLAKLLTDKPVFRTYVKNITYFLDIDNDPPVNEEAVIAKARRRYGVNAGIRPPVPASFADIASVPNLGPYMEYTSYVQTGGRVDQYPITLALLLPDVQSISIHHSRCHTTDTATATPCVDKYCLAFLDLTLQEFSTFESVKSISLKGFADVKMWSAMDFPNLQHLNLNCCLLDDWNCPTIREREEIDLPPLPSTLKLKTITVRAVDNFAFSIVKYCNDLESININHLEFGDEVPDHLDKSTRVTSFRNLHTIFTDHIREWVQFCSISDAAGVKAFPALKTLNVFLADDADNRATDRIAAHSPALEKFVFSIPTENRNTRTLDLQGCLQTHRNSLKQLDIQCNILFYDDQDPIIKLLCDALSKVQGHNSIEVLELKFRYDRYMRGINIFVPKFEQWKRLDNLLQDRAAHFPHLREVSVTINFAAGPVRPIRDLPDFWAGKEFLREPLKGLYAASGIVFTCNINHAMR